MKNCHVSHQLQLSVETYQLQLSSVRTARVEAPHVPHSDSPLLLCCSSVLSASVTAVTNVTVLHDTVTYCDSVLLDPLAILLNMSVTTEHLILTVTTTSLPYYTTSSSPPPHPICHSTITSPHALYQSPHPDQHILHVTEPTSPHSSHHYFLTITTHRHILPVTTVLPPHPISHYNLTTTSTSHNTLTTTPYYWWPGRVIAGPVGPPGHRVAPGRVIAGQVGPPGHRAAPERAGAGPAGPLATWPPQGG